MEILKEILQFNRQFVANKEYEQYQTTKFPDKQLVVLSCMDTRLVELLPKAMNLKNGDLKLIKSAGGIVSHPFGSVMRSILVALYELDAKEVAVVGHYDCGMSAIDATRLMKKMNEQGIPEETFSLLKHSGFDLKTWLRGFDDVQEAVKASVDLINNHPLLPKGTAVHGLIIDPHTGRLDTVVDGYEVQKQKAGETGE